MEETHSSKHSALNEQLLKHDFDYDVNRRTAYERAKIVASHYACAENAIAVLSNIACNRSYICYGRLGSKLGFASSDTTEEVDSIWENTILDRIHPDDVANKIAWELRFVNFVKAQPEDQRSNYFLQHKIRMTDGVGTCYFIRHRIFYLDYDAEGNVMLALCLYTAVDESLQFTDGITNSLDGTFVRNAEQRTDSLLSEREREILENVSAGKSSKLIADKLCISTSTVNNHRQNIIRKLNCQNTAQAVNVARVLGIIK